MVTSELGCGLISIGRPWGVTPEVPTEDKALQYLDAAYQAGVRFFDTAPSYGLSEQRLGKFLDSLTPEERAEVTVATKVGEHWDFDKNDTYLDNSYDSLRLSIDRSARLLGHISLLQLHRTTRELLENEDVSGALQYAVEEHGVGSIGASFNDPSLAELITNDDRFSAVQIPLNQEWNDLQPYVRPLQDAGKLVITNRPFQMGRIIGEQANLVDAYRYVLESNNSGVVLTGTSSPDHLSENMAAFKDAATSLS